MAGPQHTDDWRLRWSSLVREWTLPIVELTIRLAVICLATYLLLTTPLPLYGTSLTFAQALIILCAVALVGIAIYETLFYNHYRP